MVIFGAGASYDSLPGRPPENAGFSLEKAKDARNSWRPPLAKDLFAPRPEFEAIARQLRWLEPLVPVLQHQARGESVEQILQRRQALADGNPARLGELLAVRFYLQQLIHKCEEGWNGTKRAIPTNYRALLDQIDAELRDAERVLLVTFNYDRMIERALEARGGTFESLDDYISAPIPLFKLHGSVDWARPLNQEIPSEVQDGRWGLANFICDRAAALPHLDPIVIERTAPLSKAGQSLAVPALAIPLRSKQTFECPEEHVAALKARLPGVSGVLTIGWRAGEEMFLDLLKEHLRRDVLWSCVSGKIDDSRLTIRALQQRGLAGTFEPYPGGFTSYVVREEVSTFVTRSRQLFESR